MTIVYVMGTVLIVFAASGLAGFGVYRYLDSQRPKDDNHPYAQAPLDLGDPPGSPQPGATPTNQPIPPNPDPSPPKKDDAGNPPASDDRQKPKPDDTPKPKPDDAPKPKPDDNPKPKPDETPKPDDRLTPILAALKDKKPAVRQQALKDLAKLGEDGHPASGAVCEIMANDSTPSIQQSALEALEKIYPELSKPVLVLLVDGNLQNHVKAVHDISELGEGGSAAVPVLLAHLRTVPMRFPRETDVPKIVIEDIRALTLLASNDIRVQKAIIDSTRFTYSPSGVDEGAPVRSSALVTLGELVQKHPEQAKNVTPELIAATKTMTDMQTWRQAINQLGKMAEMYEDVRPQIVAALTARLKPLPADIEAQQQAVEAQNLAIDQLGKMAEKYEDVRPQIVAALTAFLKTLPYDGLRADAIIFVLGEMAEKYEDVRPQVAASLTVLLKAGDHDTTFVRSLAKCGREAKDALPILKQLKLNPNENVRTAASEAIAKIEDSP